MVIFWVYEDLRLVLEAAEGFGMQDAVPIALERSPIGVGLLGDLATLRLG